ncbi:NAD(P)H-dependent flavin oxidoreductase [Lihuaxuella thermophila]|uniref:Probable nitronate monooxygenase n=1 Tax=Lihuaxuella thermophila TaxID=1173111 RepID=A0A1H8FGM1_9BACL|nr:nitronate monooxygenase [Lihuaxuella thermophila]SEN30760.1 nitronate monooxygenase [Lihuaxuella thermophila]
MWPETELTRRLCIRYPIIQAGMAGGPASPKLAAAVSEAGGLGTLGAGYWPAEQLREAVRSVRRLTGRPFAVNLFVPGPYEVSVERISRVQARMRSYRRGLGLPEAIVPDQFAPSFEEQMEVVLEERVPVFSFTFGALSEYWLKALKERDIVVIGTATTVREALALEQSGVDMVVAQSGEAGGHRGTFLGRFEDALIGGMALIPAMADAVRIPVIAAGGIMDGRGIAAAMMLGAEGVQLGTSFLTCEESGAHELHQQAVLSADEESTVITRAFSGKPARGIRNRFIVEMADEEVPDYPVQNALTKDIRQAAGQQGVPEFMSMWAGQGTRLSRQLSAGLLVRTLVEETEDAVRRMTSRIGADRNQ